MKLMAQLKLLPDTEQHVSLLNTLGAANSAANWVSAEAWTIHCFGQYALHKLYYHAVRERFGLGADLTVRVFAKVADAYKLGRKGQRIFRPYGGFPFNERLVSYKLDKKVISIWTLSGREKVAFVAGAKQLQLLRGLRGECDLVYRDGTFYLYQTCDVDEDPEIDPVGFLGVDLGITNIAVDSDGTFHQGASVKGIRYRHRRLRTKLQKKGTHSCKRRLGRLAGKEHRFASDTNHCISKQIVEAAKDTGRGIALENLTHIRERVTARRGQRATLHSWAFAQLRQFITYKAALAGVLMRAVDPRNTSRTCPACGCAVKANRKTQASFSCTQCGFAGPADAIAAENIRRAAVNPPNVSDASLSSQRQGQAPTSAGSS